MVVIVDVDLKNNFLLKLMFGILLFYWNFFFKFDSI